jgi:hypothetical protein
MQKSNDHGAYLRVLSKTTTGLARLATFVWPPIAPRAFSIASCNVVYHTTPVRNECSRDEEGRTWVLMYVQEDSGNAEIKGKGQSNIAKEFQGLEYLAATKLVAQRDICRSR